MVFTSTANMAGYIFSSPVSNLWSDWYYLLHASSQSIDIFTFNIILDYGKCQKNLRLIHLCVAGHSNLVNVLPWWTNSSILSCY